MIFFLLALIFISKASAAFLGFFPKELGPVIFQYGMHPYVNLLFNFLLGGLLCLKWFWNSQHVYLQSRFYRFLLFITSLYLVFVTFLQSFFVNPDESAVLQMGSAFMAVFTMYLYGRVIPTSLKPEKFINIIRFLTVGFCLMSLVLLFVAPGVSYKGSRFIGIFKHIPHMVSCATIACFALYYSIFVEKKSRVGLALSYSGLLICFLLLVLTGTRSALASVILGFGLCVFFFQASSWATKFLKVALTCGVLLIFLLFGHDIADYAVGVARGEQSIANRAAQDGFKSRWEEVERGYTLFEKDEWLGQGLLMKFSNGQDADVAGYSANKDPHNIFVSAGVIGGWGFIFISLVAFVALAIATIKTLFSKDPALRLLAIYMLTSLPILLIYHVHLSLGGIADRIYWIVFGYMAINAKHS